MKKEINFKIRGQRSQVGNTTIYRLMPNQYTYHVGHFIFLDYIPPYMLHEKKLSADFAHPHRGIATLTYALSGEMEHFDSKGNHGIVQSGGVQWMKAGNGIIHNEAPGPDTKIGGKLMHGFQFWINLPAKHKKENPAYMALQSEELPLIHLNDQAGSLKVVVGEYDNQKSKIPTYAKQYLYHIRLNEGKKYILETEENLEYAIFLPQHDATINDQLYYSGDLIGFKNDHGTIEVVNHMETEIEFILFGGEKYTEEFIAQGPFVMSTQAEIYEANLDYQNGKYGEIIYH